MKRPLAAAGLLMIPMALLAIPVGGGPVTLPATTAPRDAQDLAPFPTTVPDRTLRVLFIHHSCGGQLLASTGPSTEEGATCIYRTHPNGGGLRASLERSRYEVHEASYGSQIGQNTELLDWLPKFRDRMETILTTSHQDEANSDARQNDIVVFKSCYTSNDFTSEGAAPGDPLGPELTVWNAKAAFQALLGEFAMRPHVLFVHVTTPPLAPNVKPERLWKWMSRALTGKPHDTDRLLRRAALARQWHDWVVRPDGWLGKGAPNNVVVFDYYDILTGRGRSSLSVFSTGEGHDSHPSTEGNQLAAEAFLPLLNRAVHRAGLAH